MDGEKNCPISSTTVSSVTPQHEGMHDIARSGFQAVPQNVIAQSPDVKLAQRLSQPRLEDVRGPLLLRNDADRRSAPRGCRLQVQAECSRVVGRP